MSELATRAPAQPKTARDAGPVLVARGIRKSFKIGKDKLEILHGVDLELERGACVSLMGASGAGKSTLLHILGLLESPSAGEVWIDGENAWKLPVQRRAALRNRKLGFVFQFYHLLPELNALENVLLPAMIQHGPAAWRARARELRQRAEELLVRFGLSERLRHKPTQLSGGERQRVALARALFLDPPLVIADEPTGNLDSATGEKVLELLFAEQRARSLTLLLVTHDERIARRCDRIVRMTDGRIAP